MAHFRGNSTDYAFPPDARRLAFTVREPFPSRATAANLIAGTIREGQHLWIDSMMPANGVIFSDGVESDFLEFNSGASVSIGLAERTVRLWTAKPDPRHSRKPGPPPRVR